MPDAGAGELLHLSRRFVTALACMDQCFIGGETLDLSHDKATSFLSIRGFEAEPGDKRTGWGSREDGWGKTLTPI